MTSPVVLNQEPPQKEVLSRLSSLSEEGELSEGKEEIVKKRERVKITALEMMQRAALEHPREIRNRLVFDKGEELFEVENQLTALLDREVDKVKLRALLDYLSSLEKDMINLRHNELTQRYQQLRQKIGYHLSPLSRLDAQIAKKKTSLKNSLASLRNKFDNLLSIELSDFKMRRLWELCTLLDLLHRNILRSKDPYLIEESMELGQEMVESYREIREMIENPEPHMDVEPMVSQYLRSCWKNSLNKEFILELLASFRQEHERLVNARTLRALSYRQLFIEVEALWQILHRLSDEQSESDISDILSICDALRVEMQEVFRERG